MRRGLWLAGLLGLVVLLGLVARPSTGPLHAGEGEGRRHALRGMRLLQEAAALPSGWRLPLLREARRELERGLDSGLPMQLLLARTEELGLPSAGYLDSLTGDDLQQEEYRFLFGQPGVFDRFVDYCRSGRPIHEHQLWHQICNSFFSRRRIQDYGQTVKPALGDVTGQLWADVGTGTGMGLVFLRESTGRTPVGQDIAPELEEYWGHLRRDRPALSDLQTVLSRRSTECGLGRDRFDGITMNEVHMAGGRLACPEDLRHRVIPWLQSIRAALKPGGRLVVVENQARDLADFQEMMRRAGFRDFRRFRGPAFHAVVGRR